MAAHREVRILHQSNIQDFHTIIAIIRSDWFTPNQIFILDDGELMILGFLGSPLNTFPNF